MTDEPTRTQPPTAPPPAEGMPAAGRQVGDYLLLGELARGGMGVVYQARQLSLDRLVALKMIRAGGLAGSAEVQRFHIEAEAAARLDHPNIVPVYEVSEHQGQPFFSMAFVEGGSLADRLRDGPLPPRAAAALIRTVALAMQYAHDRGVVHRDLKPANLLLTADGTPKVTDFGLAKRLHPAGPGPADLTVSGAVLGTPAFMAPEQAAGQVNQVGPLADVYGLGAVLFALLTGRPPFQAATVLELLDQVQNQEPPRPSRIAPAVPRDLEVICLKCLEKRPDRRFAAARELAEDLGRFLDGETIRARPAGLGRRLWAGTRRRPWAVNLLVTGLVLVVATLAYRTRTALGERAWRAHYLEAVIARLSGEPAAAWNRLERAAAVCPEGRLYNEALLNLVAEGRGARAVPLAAGWLGDGVQVTVAGGHALVHLRGLAVLDTATGRPVLALREDFRLARLDPAGTSLAVVGDGVRRWQLPSGQELPGLPLTGIRDLAFAADGRRLVTLATGPDGQGVRFTLWNLGADAPALLATRDWPAVAAWAPRPDGQALAVLADDGSTLHLWEPATGAVSTVPLAEPWQSLAFTPDGRELVGGVSEREVVRAEAVTGRVVERRTVRFWAATPWYRREWASVFPDDAPGRAPAVSPDGRWLAQPYRQADGGSGVVLWDRDAEEARHRLPGRLLGLDPGEKVWTVLRGKTPQLVEWDLAELDRALEGKAVAAARMAPNLEDTADAPIWRLEPVKLPWPYSPLVRWWNATPGFKGLRGGLISLLLFAELFGPALAAILLLHRVEGAGRGLPWVVGGGVAVVGWAAFALWTALNTFGGWPPWDLPFALLGLFSGVRLLTAVYGHHRRRTTGDATPVRLVAAPAGWKTLGGLAAVAVAGVVLMPWTDGWSGLATAAAVAVLLGLLGWTILRLGRDWSRRWRGP